MMLHQDGSTHEWAGGEMGSSPWMTATNEHYSMFFVDHLVYAPEA